MWRLRLRLPWLGRSWWWIWSWQRGFSPWSSLRRNCIRPLPNSLRPLPRRRPRPRPLPLPRLRRLRRRRKLRRRRNYRAHIFSTLRRLPRGRCRRLLPRLLGLKLCIPQLPRNTVGTIIFFSYERYRISRLSQLSTQLPQLSQL